MKLGVILVPVLFSLALGAPIEERITNGQSATIGQFPYIISMQWGILGIFQHVCGGSILSPRWVVTAAHCITETPNLGTIRAVAGLHNIGQTTTANVQIINVAQSIVNPDYAGGVAPHDIGLLYLTSALVYTDFIQPIRLPQAGTIPTGQSFLSGWGSVSTTNTPSMPTTLQFVVVPILSYEECATALINILGNQGPLATSNVCTGPLFGGISACSGDSGGPLEQNGELLGIVSWGIVPCGSNGAPSVFVRTSNYNSWIAQHVTDLN